MITECGYITIDDSLVRSMAPARPEDGHKGTFGTALINAGSRYMTGAAVLAVSSALRSGAGMVRAYAPEEALEPIAHNCPCALRSAEPEDPSDAVRMAARLLSKASSVAIGPGMDPDDKRNEALILFYIQNAKRIVIDAGALEIMSHNMPFWTPYLVSRVRSGFEPAILTPHVGEFRRLVGREASSASIPELHNLCVQFARENKCITVLKNNKTLISSQGIKCYINCVGNSGMAKGGSGDVLTGLLAGFLAQGMAAEDAAVSAVYIHAIAGDMAAEELGERAMLPTDMIGSLAKAYRRLGW